MSRNKSGLSIVFSLIFVIYLFFRLGRLIFIDNPSNGLHSDWNSFGIGWTLFLIIAMIGLIIYRLSKPVEPEQFTEGFDHGPVPMPEKSKFVKEKKVDKGNNYKKDDEFISLEEDDDFTIDLD